MTSTLSNRINEIVQMTQEKQDAINKAACASLEYITSKPSDCDYNRWSYWENTTTYDATTAVCTLSRKKYEKDGYLDICATRGFDLKIDETITFQLPKVNRSDLKGENGIENATTNIDTIKQEIFNNKDYH